jgi:alpha-1,3-rhamnosyltransferase
MNVQLNKIPLVTVGITNYNYAHYIKEALNSVVSQTYQNIELIIVDDCSTDNSIEIIENWKIKYKGKTSIKLIRNRVNMGVAACCNLIIENANGKYFQTLDADDILFSDKISQQVEMLETDGNSCMVYSNVLLIDEKGQKIGENYLKRINYDERSMPHGKIFEDLFEFNFIPQTSVLINTKMARQVGGYDNNIQVQDYYMGIKLSEQFPIIYMPQTSAFYRVHAKSLSNNPISNVRSIESVLRFKYSYYQKVNSRIQKIIKKNIHFSAAYLYEHKISSAAFWLKKDFLLNPGAKTFGYYVAIHLGIPFSFFGFIKKLIRGDKTKL